jgi:hypothetical protein
MTYAAAALAAFVTAIVTQAPPPLASGNYSGLDKITRPSAKHEVKQAAPPEKPVYGRVIEVGPSRHGLQPGPCGMPIIAADPSVDPKFVITTPESERREAKIRTAEPPKCGPLTMVPATPHGTPKKKR